MSSQEYYLVLKDTDKQYPVCKIQDSINNKKEVRISFLGTRHHYSLHEATIIQQDDRCFSLSINNQKISFSKVHIGDNPIIFTSFDEDKVPGHSDREKLAIAKLLIQDRERAARQLKYYVNRVLPLGSLPFYCLGGRAMAKNEFKQYPANKCVYYDTKEDINFVRTYFTRENFDLGIEIVVCTSLGKIGFEFSKYKLFK